MPSPLPAFEIPTLIRNLGEVTVSIVVVNQRRDRLKQIRVAIGSVSFAMLSTPDIFEVPLDVSQHYQIQKAVIIQIYPRRAYGPAAPADAGLFRYVLEGAVFLLVVEPVPVGRSALLRDGTFGCGIAERRAVHEKNIQSPIVVVVKQRDASTHGFDQIVFRNMGG